MGRKKAHERRHKVYLSLYNEVLNVPIRVLLHPTGARRDPAAQSGELVRVWFVAHREPSRAHLSL